MVNTMLRFSKRKFKEWCKHNDEDYNDSSSWAETIDGMTLDEIECDTPYLACESWCVSGEFADDKEKMVDFMSLSKDEFLESYCYLTEDEWEDTFYKVMGVLFND